LEKLSFTGEGYNTLVTTQDHSIIRTTTSTKIYELPLLDDADALPLFCFWAFGQKYIPSNANNQLVKQVMQFICNILFYQVLSLVQFNDCDTVFS